MVDRNIALSVVRSPRIENMDMNSRSHEPHLMNIMKITTINLYRNVFYIKDFLDVALLLISLRLIILHFNVAKKKKQLFNVHIVNHRCIQLLLEGPLLKLSSQGDQKNSQNQLIPSKFSTPGSLFNILSNNYPLTWRNIHGQ